MAKEHQVSESRQTVDLTSDVRETALRTDKTGTETTAQRSKLSVNVNHEISERLRNLAYLHRLSESSIVEIALAMFFARGDDELLGVMLKQLGATRRSKS
jgi:hypothetical protein